MPEKASGRRDGAHPFDGASGARAVNRKRR